MIAEYTGKAFKLFSALNLNLFSGRNAVSYERLIGRPSPAAKCRTVVVFCH